MSGTKFVIKELKKQLKLHEIQYRDIATQLELSEGSVKRLLADGSNISLSRLEKICQLIRIDLTELFRLASRTDQGLQTLSFEQEQMIVPDKVLLLVSVSVLNGFKYEEIISRYNINKNVLIQKLAELDRMRIIELMPDNRIRLLLSPKFDWIGGGPIQSFFLEEVLPEFFNSYFSRQDEKLVMATGLMSPHTNQKFQGQIQKLVDDFHEACDEDSNLDINDRNGTSIVIALRRWHFDMFDTVSSNINK
ncbi:helix-turn-helix domain-containing protein [Vibrio genomosp. F6]|uniref:Transcriptional regulator n=1 Tax=Vibrio genomosp. F6 str. FF-238 TaxID=1191298 RepID=A0A1E5CNX4_9VIBR|nr:helix-turn-helix transcriptional regulator [Vibrio genomosp. F6]OEE71262.1 transcriptional regulator [Vibrio genomosp. F6 str. FF-238]